MQTSKSVLNFHHITDIIRRILAKHGLLTAERKKKDVNINFFDEIIQAVSISSNHTHVPRTLLELVIDLGTKRHR